MNTAVYGNLALKPSTQGPALSIVDGGKAKPRAVAPRQIAAPDVYASASSRSSSRLSTRLSVLALTAAAVLVVALSFGIATAQSAAQNAAIANAERVEISVQTGDTLWDIAEQHGIESLGTGKVVSLIKEWNGLSNSMLYAGMDLTVPAAR